MSIERRFRATRLPDTLRHQGRSQRWLAARIGVHESYLSRVISGEKTLSETQARLVAEVLEAPLFVLFELLYRSESITPERPWAS